MFKSVSEIPTDKRSRHGKEAKLDAKFKLFVSDHINPWIESHAIRDNSSIEYIAGGLTVAELMLLVCLKAFVVPRKDPCEAYKNALDKEQLTSSYQLHQEEKSLRRIEQKQDVDEC
ncbi:unnamed protein product [Arctia plantaginis]|uniref:Uncharacterized protein n=1 Tax=Arctia plantaginis TaxID=874455 RepID=A0A8S1BGN5_ARCPL|nr:unnamed protein product [Arctia plantaginis]